MNGVVAGGQRSLSGATGSVLRELAEVQREKRVPGLCLTSGPDPRIVTGRSGIDWSEEPVFTVRAGPAELSGVPDCPKGLTCQVMLAMGR